jgi:hypothetical protein
MTHVRYWAMSLATAVAGAFIAIDRFAFVPRHASRVAFGVAIAAAVFSLGATAVAALRENYAFAGLSGLSAVIAASTIVATRVFNGTTALWLAFAGGIALLLVSLRSLAQHEATIERVVHQLELDGSDSATGASRQGRVEISNSMRSWLHWLSQTTIALGGAFVVASTFIWRHGDTATLSPRWLAFGVAAVAASIGVLSLGERLFDARRHRFTPDRIAAIAVTVLGVGVAGALTASMTVVTLPYHVRWTAFGLGLAMVGVALVASIVHELTTERVRHELEVAHGSARELVGPGS